MLSPPSASLPLFHVREAVFLVFNAAIPPALQPPILFPFELFVFFLSSPFHPKFFSNHWKMPEKFFQSLENPPRFFQPLENFFPIIGKPAIPPRASGLRPLNRGQGRV